VIGARCAGAATAMLMARRGMRVLMIDRGEYGADTLSTHALMRGGVLLLHRWGVLPRVLEMGTPPVRSTSFHYGAEAIEVAIRSADGIDALCAPRRTVLDSLLVDAAAEAGVHVRHAHTLVDLLRRPDGRVAGAVLRDTEGRRLEVAADLVVGADGIASTMARLAEAPVQRTALHASAVVYGYWSGIGASGYHWHYGNGAAAGVIPTNAGSHCIFAATTPARYRQAIRQDVAAGYHRVLREVAPGLADTVASARPASRLWIFAGRPGFMRRPCGPGWALVGDAGYFKDPISAPSA
jgi:2-polyprenyl-6-methoxyphenol hydroxylase-like FAD-dependent oxidoreductase